MLGRQRQRPYRRAMAAVPMPAPVGLAQAHRHVAVDDLKRSIGFYSTLFGAGPTVVKSDYAKWMLDDPRVNFAISTRAGRSGIDHVGIGSDFDGITMWPVGLDDVSSYPRLTDELLRRGYSAADVHKILGGNVLRAFRQAGEVAKQLRETSPPEVDEIKPEKRMR